MAVFSAAEITTFCKRERGRFLLQALEDAMKEAEREWDWFDQNNGPSLTSLLRGLATVLVEGQATPRELKQTRLVYDRLTSTQYFAAMVARSFTRKLFEAMVAQTEAQGNL
jgi:hypothetical protein